MVDEVPKETPLTGCLVHMVWSFVGLGVLSLFLLDMAVHDRAPLSFESIGFWIVVGLVVVARYVDLTCYAGTVPNDGASNTLRDANRFSAGVVVIAGAAWMLVHAL